MKPMPLYEANRVLDYTPEQLFDLAADVERYPEFLPWWVAARVLRRGAESYQTEQIIGFGPIRQRFTSRTVLHRPTRIEVTSTERPFERFLLRWTFERRPSSSCHVALAVDMTLRAEILQDLFDQTLARGVAQIMTSFEARARQLYGPPPTPTTQDKTSTT
jgi:coenzyme Q-binding protein COQ10